MRALAFAVLTAAACIGCSEENRSTTATTAKPVTNGTSVDRDATTVTPAKPQAETVTAAKPVSDATTVDRDNTAINKRDRNSVAKTPIDQNENKKDIDVTATIRKRVVAIKMSVNAHNVKIMTQDGKVTLRGPVKSADEKKQIEDIARDVAGKANVDSQLEVETKP
jgi:hyperosmotically inducible periplasmic protein